MQYSVTFRHAILVTSCNLDLVRSTPKSKSHVSSHARRPGKKNDDKAHSILATDEIKAIKMKVNLR